MSLCSPDCITGLIKTMKDDFTTNGNTLECMSLQMLKSGDSIYSCMTLVYFPTWSQIQKDMSIPSKTASHITTVHIHYTAHTSHYTTHYTICVHSNRVTA